MNAATLLVIDQSRRKFVPAPRKYSGQMCGTYLDNLPPIPGGARDPRLVLTWLVFYHTFENRQRIYADHKAKGLLDFLVSWPDFQDAGGTPQGFLDHCNEILDAGLRPCAMLSAKPTSSSNIRTIEETLANIMLVLPLLLGVVPRLCIGWELSLWMSPADLWFLIRNLCPIWLKYPGTLGYIHLQEGYIAFQFDGHDTGSFWWMVRGLLHGILFQRKFDETPTFKDLQDRMVDALQRFAGQFNYPPDNGINGEPFIYTGLELTAMDAYWKGMSEFMQDQWAHAAVTTPPVMGPAGMVIVEGSGNGVG